AVHRLVVPLPPVQSRLARDYSGASIRYPVPASVNHQHAAHPLAGGWLPPGAVVLADSRQARLAELFHDGRFVLLDRSDGTPGPAGTPEPAGTLESEGTLGRVRTVPYRDPAPASLPPAVLVRPDGYVAWASDEPDPAARSAAARDAIRQWCEPGVLAREG
ncbi:MAG: hypothetical protein ACRDNZ_00235, partial [Streptosporangiaceae bacterium]